MSVMATAVIHETFRSAMPDQATLRLTDPNGEIQTSTLKPINVSSQMRTTRQLLEKQAACPYLGGNTGGKGEVLHHILTHACIHQGCSPLNTPRVASMLSPFFSARSLRMAGQARNRSTISCYHAGRGRERLLAG